MELYWPHETTLEATSSDATPSDVLQDLLYLARLRLRTRFASEPYRSQLKREYSKRFFRIMNGTCPWVEGKYEFTQIVRKLGYSAPDSILVDRKADRETLLIRVARLDEDSDKRLCKPLDDSVGRGLYLANTSAQAVAFAYAQNRPYLVQSFMPPVDAELRYVLHRTSADIEMGRGPSVRLAFTKQGPEVVGNGSMTVKELIRNQKWSQTDKNKLCLAASDRIPARDECIKLVNSGGVLRRRSFGLPSAEILEQIDAMVLKFLVAYEKHIKGTLATACFDIGITPEGPVFYELQFPFSHPYGSRLDGVKSPASHKAARTRLKASIYSSGQVKV